MFNGWQQEGFVKCESWAMKTSKHFSSWTVDRRCKLMEWAQCHAGGKSCSVACETDWFVRFVCVQLEGSARETIWYEWHLHVYCTEMIQTGRHDRICPAKGGCDHMLVWVMFALPKPKLSALKKLSRWHKACKCRCPHGISDSLCVLILGGKNAQTI